MLHITRWPGRVTQRLSRRGLHRPALEVAKLLLALDSHDPTGTLSRPACASPSSLCTCSDVMRIAIVGPLLLLSGQRR